MSVMDKTSSKTQKLDYKVYKDYKEVLKDRDCLKIIG